MTICRFVLLAVALAGMPAVSAATPGDASDASDLPSAAHYSIEYAIFPADGRLEGRATITIENITTRSWREIPFLLYRLLEVERITTPEGTPIEFVTDIVRDADARDL